MCFIHVRTVSCVDWLVGRKCIISRCSCVQKITNVIAWLLFPSWRMSTSPVINRHPRRVFIIDTNNKASQKNYRLFFSISLRKSTQCCTRSIDRSRRQCPSISTMTYIILVILNLSGVGVGVIYEWPLVDCCIHLWNQLLLTIGKEPQQSFRIPVSFFHLYCLGETRRQSS